MTRVYAMDAGLDRPRGALYFRECRFPPTDGVRQPATPDRSEIMRLRLAAALPGFAFLASCTAFRPPPEVFVYAPRRDAVAAAADVFERYRIPVEQADTEFGLVQSGAFDIHDGWNGMTLDQVVECDWRSDRTDEGRGPVTLALYVRVPDEKRIRGRVTSSGVEVRPGIVSRIHLGGRGSLRRDGDPIHCGLTPEFSQELLDAIAMGAGGAVEARVADGDAPGTHVTGGLADAP